MKKYWPIALMLFCALVITTSCSKDDDVDTAVEYAEWKLENEVAFQEVAADTENYSEIKSLGNDGSIYVKILKEGTGTTNIMFNDSVKCYYTGKYINGEVFDSAEFPYKDPAIFAADKVIAGWTLALEYMHIGDRWNVWIPQQLAYGSGKFDQTTGTYLVKPYSTLNFEMEVVAIIRNGVTYTK